nr:MAG TPA: hypothetical protein [Caudoviricetes sp.]
MGSTIKKLVSCSRYGYYTLFSLSLNLQTI